MRSEPDSTLRFLLWWTSSSRKVRRDPKKETRSGRAHRTKGGGEDVMMKQFRLRSLLPYLGWVHFHHCILFNNSQIFCDLQSFQLASSLHFNVTISTKSCVYELCFAGTVCQQTCHYAPQCPCTLKWYNFKQNTAKKRRGKQHLKARQALEAMGGGSPVCRVWTPRSRRRSSHRWLLRVEGLIQESNPWMFDVRPNICVYDSQTGIFREGERMEITLSYEEDNK